MESRETKSALGMLGLGATLGLAIVISAMIGSKAIIRVKSQGQIIQVTGFAEKHITSDWATWTCRFDDTGSTISVAYKRVEAARATVMAFLKEQGATDENLEMFPASVQEVRERNERGQPTNRIAYYVVSESIRLSSPDVNLIANTCRNSSELLKKNISLHSGSPEYFYRKQNELKFEMLGKATANAYKRAELLAEQSNSSIGAPRFIRQGVFQVTPAYSTAVSDYGINDTTSIEKNFKAIVSVHYSIKE